jgi:hypothetical protein
MRVGKAAQARVRRLPAELSGGGYGSGHDEENRVFPRPLSLDRERGALDRPASLFDSAQLLHQLALGGRTGSAPWVLNQYCD